MADNSYGDLRIQKAPDLTGAFSAARGEQRDFSTEDDFDQDISAILNGSKAITGKAVWSANNAARRTDVDETKHREEAESKKLERELIRMAEWDAAKVTIGGVEMTNAEAQDARRAVIENGDRYAKWAVEHGYLNHGEEDQFKDAARRMYELKEAERTQGSMTSAQRDEWKALQTSRAGQAVDATVAEVHLEHAPHSGPASEASTNTLRDNPFPTAPLVNVAFSTASSASPNPGEATPTNSPSSVPKPQSSAPAF